VLLGFGSGAWFAPSAERSIVVTETVQGLQVGAPVTYNGVVVGEVVEIGVDLLPFVLFCGLSICGSAFAILARILDERKLFSTRMGPVLLGCAVVDDMAVWGLAAIILAISASSGIADVPLTLIGLALFVALLFLVVRPLLERITRRFYDEGRGLSPDLLAVLLVGLLASACYTTWLGISPILGSFLFGAAVPRQGTESLLRETTARMESLSVLVLLPVFFVVTGLGVDLSTIGWDGLAILVLFVVIATGGKLVGAGIAARSVGFRGRRAVAVGCLMNTRGLTELALLAEGRRLGVLNDTMFTVLVTTAVATTLLAGPMLRLVYPSRLIRQDIEDAERARLAESDAYRILVLVERPAEAGPVVELAAAVAAGEPGAEVVISNFAEMRPHGELGSGFVGDLNAMTGALEQLRGLAALVEARGVSEVRLSQLTNDVGRDLVAQVDRLRPSLVLLVDDGEGRNEELARTVVREARVDAAIVRPPASLAAVRTIAVASCPEPDQTLAAEVALRLARGLALPLALPVGLRADDATIAASLAPSIASAADIGPLGSGIAVASDLPLLVGAGGTVDAVISVHATISAVDVRTLGPLQNRLGAATAS
jgi:Kef-type K+ transport system membrane component KefB